MSPLQSGPSIAPPLSRTNSVSSEATMNTKPTTPPSSSTTPPATPRAKKYKLVDDILTEPCLYRVLGLERNCTTEEIRRAYIGRSRVCHPDKFVPAYPRATEAFQKLSLAYETLSKSSSRHIYDLTGPSSGRAGAAFAKYGAGDFSTMDGDETLQAVLYQLFLEFMDGDFETIRTCIRALNEMNPSLNFGEEVIDTIEVAFRKLREVFLSTQKYFKLVRFELMRLYELQHKLRQLSYFDILGRLRLTMTIARVMMQIPIKINVASKGEDDKAAAAAGKEPGKEPGKEENTTAAKERREGGIFGDRVEKVLRMVVGLLEKGEKLATTSTRGTDSDSDNV